MGVAITKPCEISFRRTAANSTSFLCHSVRVNQRPCNITSPYLWFIFLWCECSNSGRHVATSLPPRELPSVPLFITVTSGRRKETELSLHRALLRSANRTFCTTCCYFVHGFYAGTPFLSGSCQTAVLRRVHIARTELN